MIEGDQLAPWNVRPEACANRADLQDCGKDCLLSSHVDVLEKEKPVLANTFFNIWKPPEYISAMMPVLF